MISCAKGFASLVSFISALTVMVDTSSANITLGIPFSDHMVLQRNVSVPVWGKATPAEAVTVVFRGQTKTAKTGSDGKWMIHLDATAAGGPFEMSIDGANSIKLSDVMVGEVWICTGQSNMANTMRSIGGANLDSAKLADYPDIRLMGDYPTLRKWHHCTPDSVLNFSATGYYFALNLHRSLKIPVGVIAAAVGGTPVERWLDSATFKADALLASGTVKNDLYAAYIHPLVPYATRGFIWYQGESNANASTGPYYRDRFGALIKGWRKLWGAGELPFYYVQLASYKGSNFWPPLREAQRLTLALPNTAMAVSIDIGDSANIHPKNKSDVGKRLALPARALLYGEKNLIYSGPLYESALVRGKSLRLRFRFAESGLVAKDIPDFQTGGKLIGFTLAGADTNWYPAEVVINKDTLILTSSKVPVPAKARYAWASVPQCNLYNGAGLPASPFQTEGLQLPVSLDGSKAYAIEAGTLHMAPVEAVFTDALGRSLGQGRSRTDGLRLLTPQKAVHR